MNPNRAIYGRLTINGEKKSLGKAPGINEILQRIQQQFIKHEYRGNDLKLLVELSFDELPKFESLMTREQQLEAEFAQMSQVDPDAIFLEETGLTHKQLSIICADPLFIQYQEICDPAKRMGLDESFIARIRDEANAKFEPHLHHLAKWRVT